MADAHLFDAPHVAALAVIALVSAVLARVVRGAPDRGAGLVVRRALALGAPALLLLDVAYEARAGTDWRLFAPLELCDLAAFATTAALLRSRPMVFELLFFWAFAGTVPALMTPDLGGDYPSLRFFAYFALHGTVVAAAAVATFGLRLRPRRGAGLRVFGITFAYAAAMFAVDLAFDANFLYLRAKPDNASPLDWLGPWPWYVAAGVAIAFALFTALELLFRERRG